MSRYSITHVGAVRPVLALSEQQRALRALRPSFTSIMLPKRWIAAPVVSVHIAGPLRMPVLCEHVVPVFERVRRHVAVH